MTWVDNAVIYQVYPRSFADGNGDGVGDLAGLRARLPYLRDLGRRRALAHPLVRSPMADAGYDVADYRDIDPLFGTLAEAERPHRRGPRPGLRVIVDIVPNHCSDQHPLVPGSAARPGRGSPERELFWFRAGRTEPAQRLAVRFGGPAWTQVPDGEWYLHLFAARAARLELGAPRRCARTSRPRCGSGSTAASTASASTSPTSWSRTRPARPRPDPGVHPYATRTGVHEIYRSWRKIADSYPQRAGLRRRAVGADADRFTRYLRPDELHTGVQLPLPACPWDAGALRDVIDTTLATHALIGAPPTWVLSNHDVVRHVTRYGRSDTGHTRIRAKHDEPSRPGAGHPAGPGRRAAHPWRCPAALPLPGRGAGPARGRGHPGGAAAGPALAALRAHRPRPRRLPRAAALVGQAPPFGFSPTAGADRGCRSRAVGGLTAQAQARDPASMLSLYRAALAHRPTGCAFAWLDLGPGSLAFTGAS